MQNGKLLYEDIFEGAELIAGVNVIKDEVLKDNGLARDALLNSDTMIRNNSKPKIVKNEANKALCLAEGDLEIGRACMYRARSNFYLGRYSLIAADIALAKKKLAKIPDLAGLANFEECARSFEHAKTCSFSSLVNEFELSVPADAKIPCFAHGLEIKQSKKFGKHIVTNRNLEIGETVIIEEAYCIASNAGATHSHCAFCFEENANLIPCKNCSAVMFCSQKCHDIGHKKFHAMECGKASIYAGFGCVFQMIFRTVIQALGMYKNVQELMGIIEKFNNEKPNSMLNCADPSLRSYLQFLGLRQSNLEYIDGAANVYAAIKSHSAYESVFKSPEASRFLAHLITHHMRVIYMNGIRTGLDLFGTGLGKLGPVPVHPSEVAQALGIYLNSSLLEHSCQPNIGRIFYGNKLIGKVIRPIKQREQPFISKL